LFGLYFFFFFYVCFLFGCWGVFGGRWGLGGGGGGLEPPPPPPPPPVGTPLLLASDFSGYFILVKDVWVLSRFIEYLGLECMGLWLHSKIHIHCVACTHILSY